MEARLAFDHPSVIGESPCWSASDGSLYWTDIDGRVIHRWMVSEGQLTSYRQPFSINAVVSRSAVISEGCQSLIAVAARSINSFDPAAQSLRRLADIAGVPEHARLNDAKPDRSGRLWFGSMRLTGGEDLGRIFCMSTAGDIAEFSDRFSVANGMAWSPDDSIFYVADTGRKIVYQYDFDIALGRISNRRAFLDLADDPGKPDGLSTDCEGNVWVAMWDGWCIRCYSPDGNPRVEVRVPVPRPTSLAFGEPELDTLFITSANKGLAPPELAHAPYSGCVFSFHTDIPGQPVGCRKPPLPATGAR